MSNNEAEARRAKYKSTPTPPPPTTIVETEPPTNCTIIDIAPTITALKQHAAYYVFVLNLMNDDQTSTYDCPHTVYTILR